MYLRFFIYCLVWEYIGGVFNRAQKLVTLKSKLGVTFESEDLKKIWDTFFKNLKAKIATLRWEKQKKFILKYIEALKSTSKLL